MKLTIEETQKSLDQKWSEYKKGSWFARLFPVMAYNAFMEGLIAGLDIAVGLSKPRADSGPNRV